MQPKQARIINKFVNHVCAPGEICKPGVGTWPNGTNHEHTWFPRQPRGYSNITRVRHNESS